MDSRVQEVEWLGVALVSEGGDGRVSWAQKDSIWSKNIVHSCTLITLFSGSRKGSPQRIFKNMNQVYYRLPGQFPVNERFEIVWILK